MEKTKNLYDEWSASKRKLQELKEDISSLQTKVEKRATGDSSELYADVVDKMIQDSTDLSEKKQTTSLLSSRIEEIEEELISRIKATNAKSIRIPSDQDNVLDNEIYLNKNGKLESSGRM